MFEALFRISTLVESNGQGEYTFKVSKKKEPVSALEFSSLIKSVYQQQVAPMLQSGDEFTTILHVNLPNHELEKMVCVRENGQFEADWLPEPTTDMTPLISSMYDHFRPQLLPGNVFTMTFHVQRF